MRTALCVILSGIIYVASAHAGESRIVLNKKEQSFTPDPKTCAEKDICDLKSVVFRVEQMRSPAQDDEDIDAYGTDFYASYKTRSLETLTKYAFVQFIRGCVYRSAIGADGKIETNFSIVRRYMGKGRLPFRHLDWSLDSNDKDPVFTSEPSEAENRHYFAEWLSPGTQWKPGFLGHFYGEQKPRLAQLYVSDNVPLAYVFDGVAQNVSLELRMCLYKTADVPRDMSSNGIDLALPIACSVWRSSNVYDHEGKRFEHPKEVVATCNRPFNSAEEERNRFLNEKVSPETPKEPEVPAPALEPEKK